MATVDSCLSARLQCQRRSLTALLPTAKHQMSGYWLLDQNFSDLLFDFMAFSMDFINEETTQRPKLLICDTQPSLRQVVQYCVQTRGPEDHTSTKGSYILALKPKTRRIFQSHDIGILVFMCVMGRLFFLAAQAALRAAAVGLRSLPAKASRRRPWPS